MAPNKKSQTNFPVRLHYILMEMEKDGLDHIMSWKAEGRAVVVHDPKLLEERILPTWFCQSKFSSFQRQLNIYGFTRIASGPNKGGYFHERFVRGEPELAKQIPRVKDKKKSKAAQGSSSPNTNSLTIGTTAAHMNNPNPSAVLSNCGGPLSAFKAPHQTMLSPRTSLEATLGINHSSLMSYDPRVQSLASICTYPGQILPTPPQYHQGGALPTTGTLFNNLQHPLRGLTSGARDSASLLQTLRVLNGLLNE